MSLLTLKGLAERWSLPESATKRIVRDRSVPFIGLGSGHMKINWRKARFREEAILSWEEKNQQVCPNTAVQSCRASGQNTSTAPPSLPTPMRSRHSDAGGPPLLGDWRGRGQRKTGNRCR